MAHLVRPSKTYHVDAAGRRVPKGTPGSKKVREKAAKWYGQGVPGYLVRRTERGQAGLPDRDAARLPLADHLAAFESDMALGLASKGGKKKQTPPDRQVKLTVTRVRELLAGCRFAQPADLNTHAPAKLGKYLRERAKTPHKEGGLSAQTATFYLAAARRFARWLSAKAVVRPDLFDGLPGFDPDSGRVHARREVSPDELAQLIDAAKTSKKSLRHLAGPDRAMQYLVAFATGYRAGELAVLTPEHFTLGDMPAATLPARFTKNNKRARQPLPPGLAAQLRGYLAGRAAGKPVWPGKWSVNPAAMLRRDLTAANVPYCVETIDGPRYADFHALRHSYLSALAAAEVGVKQLQELARHSSPHLTLGIYTHARAETLSASVARLQMPGEVAANTLDRMSRADLETAVVALAALVNVLTGVPAAVTPRDTPTGETSGDRSGPPGTHCGGSRAA